MQYEALPNFISSDMRMSHVYQPVMIRTLLHLAGALPLRLSRSNCCTKDAKWYWRTRWRSLFGTHSVCCFGYALLTHSRVAIRAGNTSSSKEWQQDQYQWKCRDKLGMTARRCPHSARSTRPRKVTVRSIPGFAFLSSVILRLDKAPSTSVL